MSALDQATIRSALAATGRHLRLDRDVEILLVGGAAGVLTGLLPAAWTTADVDTIHCHLARDRDAVLDAAADAGRELALPPAWLNDWSGLYVWTLPPGWQSRRVLVGTFGRLHVFAVGRQDLIALKFIAHRERDLEHLRLLIVTPAERDAVRTYLDQLARDNPAARHPDRAGRIELARAYVDAWEAPQ